jgi:hypothetical protein
MSWCYTDQDVITVMKSRRQARARREENYQLLANAEE